MKTRLQEAEWLSQNDALHFFCCRDFSFGNLHTQTQPAAFGAWEHVCRDIVCPFKVEFDVMHVNTIPTTTTRIWQPVPNNNKDLAACANNNNNDNDDAVFVQVLFKRTFVNRDSSVAALTQVIAPPS